MAKDSKRPPRGPQLKELIELRRKKFPGLMAREFATEILGVHRLHMCSVENGRRQPSIELALKWIEILGPEANIDMFGDIPTVAAIRKFQALTQKAA